MTTKKTTKKVRRKTTRQATGNERKSIRKRYSLLGEKIRKAQDDLKEMKDERRQLGIQLGVTVERTDRVNRRYEKAIVSYLRACKTGLTVAEIRSKIEADPKVEISAAYRVTLSYTLNNSELFVRDGTPQKGLWTLTSKAKKTAKASDDVQENDDDG